MQGRHAGTSLNRLTNQLCTNQLPRPNGSAVGHQFMLCLRYVNDCDMQMHVAKTQKASGKSSPLFPEHCALLERQTFPSASSEIVRSM